MDPLVVLVDAAPPARLLPSPSRLPPFSISEFRALVSTALDSDAPAPPLALSLRTSSPSLQRKKSAHNLHIAPSASRVRLLLTKLKKRAAALIVRRRRHSSTATLRASATMPCDLDRSSGGDSLFAPYLPLVAQYERGLAVPSSYSFTCASPPSGPSSSAPPSPPPSESPCASESSHAPPSPTASTFSDSTCTSEERPYSVFTADAPFPYDGAGVDADPFAKGAVRVVHHSCDALPLSASYSPPRLLRRGGRATPRASMRRTGQGRRFHSSANAKEEGGARVDDSGVYVQEESYEEPDWTLALPTPSQASFYPPRTSTPPPQAGPSSPARPSPMVHTGNAFPPSSGSSLARAPTARTFPVATSPKTKSRRLPRRPSSPFPLPLIRSATSSTAPVGYYAYAL
ncbi:hypothetical protein MVEN_01953400 [Mycena venus]|uniref:Uncharacterized protein n=1 Tax=Mycena venus TaxID=2733690 RepID=A0A8H6XH00_9AGAR|nr:hypothetical protein MVEN_01953400 [Mycena venus]